MTNLPEGFIERFHNMWGSSVVDVISRTFKERPTTFRVNTLKTTREVVLENLKQNNFICSKVDWYKDAFILTNKNKRELTELQIYKEGKIYIQSLASMLPPLLLDPKPGEKVLDLTAAPGSKTSQIAALMNGEGELVANDNSKERFFKLKRNLESLGVGTSGLNLTLRLEHGARIGREYPEYFHKVLLDAPCSSEARFIENDSKSFGYWKAKKLNEIAKRQRPLIKAALQALQIGGTMVYSTCTLAPEENEMQIDWLLKRLGEYVEILPITDKETGVRQLPAVLEWKGKTLHSEVTKTFRVFPTEQIEGFFLTKLRKLRNLSDLEVSDNTDH